MGNMLFSDEEINSDEMRTDGDGMESLDNLHDLPTVQAETAGASLSLLNLNMNRDTNVNVPERKSNTPITTIKPLENMQEDNKKLCSTVTKQSPKQLPPKEKLIVLKPMPAKSLDNSNNNTSTLSKAVTNSNKQREPKFVPYEPYKGATRSMTTDCSVKTHSRKPSQGSTSSMASGASSTQLNTLATNSVSNSKPTEIQMGINVNSRRSKEDKLITKESHHQQNYDESDRRATNNFNSYQNNNTDMELSGHSLLLLKERLKIHEKDILELRVENSRLKKMLVDSLSGFGSSSNGDMSQTHTSKCQLDGTECSSMSESVDNLTDEIEVWRSKFLSTCVLVEQLTKQNQDWKRSISSAANLFRELKQRSEVVLTPDLFDKINSWLLSNAQRHVDSPAHENHSRSSSFNFSHDISGADDSMMNQLLS